MIRRMPAEGNIYIKNRIVILPICLSAAAGVSVAATSGNVTLALPQGGADVVIHQTAAGCTRAVPMNAAAIFMFSAARAGST